jgi:hypothetical protein
MINNRELTDGIDEYVIKLFNCGVLDDVTVDSNAQRSSTFNLVHLIFCDFTLMPWPSLFYPTKFFVLLSVLFSRELLVFRTSRQPLVANFNTLIGLGQARKLCRNWNVGRRLIITVE